MSETYLGGTGEKQPAARLLVSQISIPYFVDAWPSEIRRPGQVNWQRAWPGQAKSIGNAYGVHWPGLHKDGLGYQW